MDRVKWFYKKLILDVEAQGKVDEETRWDAVQNRSAYQRRRLGKVEQLKQRLNWYGTPRTTSVSQNPSRLKTINYQGL